MIASRLLPALFAVVVPLSALSCDASEPDPFTQAVFPVCEAHTGRIVGTIDNMSIDVTLPPPSGGLSQGNDGGDFQYQGYTPSDPAQPDLRLTWDHLTRIGDVVDARGTLHLVEGRYAGETFCTGAGTRIRMPGNETVLEFALTGLASGDGCTVPHIGGVLGCVRY